ncbi:cytochrome b562 [Acerihabitans sp. TG2]|uniref:cytochrome b562 n=1 Tax=Acerihabitans sp. TG2 TaxID=3096008 RepID=UPI002B2391C1|nr:cytochrome b562 [Acerihabitans sp. TG2]MEA9390327.1 cytochrome b562 [Acerihabitans sp. TG2]
MKIKIIAMLSFTLLMSSPLMASARDLGENMDILAANVSTVMKSDNVDTLKKALANMHEAAMDALKDTPPKLQGQPADGPKMKDYRQGMTNLINQIEQAQALAAKGDVAQVKVVAKQFKQTRDENHAKFR